MAIKISIVIPTCKRPQLLQRCLHALIAQDFKEKDYEIIVVTDGLDEETNHLFSEPGVFSSFSNICCYSLPFRKGPAAARNAGWRIANGELILFTDDDCIPSINWIKNFYNAYQFYDESDMALTGRIVVPLPTSPTDFELNTARLEEADFVTANCACTKKALEMVNGFDEAFTMAWREDSDLQFRLLKKQVPIKKIEEAIVVHPARKAPWGVSLKEQRKSMFNALLFKNHPQLYKEKIGSPVMLNYYLMIVLLVTFFVEWFRDARIVALICLAAWLYLTIGFILKRLSNASLSIKHITEIIATSILIPFVSVFWNLYGAVKFKVLRV